MTINNILFAHEYLLTVPGAGQVCEVRDLETGGSDSFRLYALDNVLLLPRGLVIGQQEIAIRDSIIRDHHVNDILAQQATDIAAGLVPAPCQLAGDYVSLLGTWSEGFWHWMMEFLPKAVIAEKTGFQGKYIIPPKASSFVAESLQLIGVSMDRIVTSDADAGLQLQKLYLPQRFLVGHDKTYLSILKLLREQLLKNVMPSAEPPGRVYISRKHAENGRRVVNEQELTDMLHDFVFQSVHMEHKTLEEQIQLMSNVNCLIGPHGAAMFHSLVMPAASTVMELFAPTYINPCMTSAMELLGHNYFMITSPHGGIYQHGWNVEAPLNLIRMNLLNQFHHEGLKRVDMKTQCPDRPTVSRCIEYHRDQKPDAHCCTLRVSGQWHTYTRGEFWDYVSRYATLFATLPETRRILFIKKMDIHLLAAYIGAMHAGHIPALISLPTVKMNASEYAQKLSHIRKMTGFGAVFTDAPESRLTDMQAGSVFTPEDIPANASPVEPVQTTCALVQFSSGSTGLQKGVTLTHSGIITHMKNYGDTLQLSTTDAIVSWLPLYHDMGLIACYLMPLMHGIPFYQMDPFDWILEPDLLLKVIEEKKPTLCFLPNFAYQVLAQKGRPHDLSSIRLWINCSEPARLHSHEAFLGKYPSVRQESLTVCYALAENTFAVSQTLPGHHNSTRQHPQRGVLSCGRPIKDVDVKVFPRDDQTDGEIGVKSPTLFHGFLDGSVPLTDGFYLTGDLGFIDDQGEVFITGRKKDLIIVNGKNIFPQDVESAVSGIAAVYPGRAVAFGIWNEATGSEDLVMLAERKEGEPTTHLKIAIQKAVMEEIGIVPKRVEILEHMSLVKTSSGKLSRSRNKELYQAKEFKLL